MSVIYAIGRFFKKIWNWIKQTAWIQPLLIVGIIFGIIFSIRPIVDATKRSKQKRGEYNAFYNNYRLLLSDAKNMNSEADKFTIKLESLMEGSIDAETFKSECGADVGDKFFLAYVAKECSVCDTIRDGFITFKSRLDSKAAGFNSDCPEFHMVTIFADEEKYSDSKPEETPFYDYCLNHAQFFGDVAGYAGTTDYCNAGGINEGDLEDLASADCEQFNTPTIMLVEVNSPEVVTEVMFGVEGSDKNERAKTLYECWEHKGKFSADIKD